jgi:hypothetical protein
VKEYQSMSVLLPICDKLSVPVEIAAAVALVLFGSKVFEQEPPLESVVKFEEAVNAELPLEQTACTWNSYCVLAVNPEMGFEVVVEVVGVQVKFPTLRY